MSTPDLDETTLTVILRNAGLNPTPEQVRSILPGVKIAQGMIARVRAPLPREAEPAVTFNPDQRP